MGELAPQVRALLTQLRTSIAPAPVHELRQTKRTSQFYDIRWLYKECIANASAGTWLLFSDDDDLWGPQRVRIYKNVIGEHASSPGVTAVCATHKVRPAHRSVVASSVKEVDEHLRSGAAVHFGGVQVGEEFFDFACPSESLGAFLNLCNDSTLLHPFADLRFTRFLSEYYQGGRVIYFPTDKVNPWVYYYSTAYRTPEDEEAFEQFDAQGQASTVVRVEDGDLEEAMAIARERNGGKNPSKEDLDAILDFVSTLRQNIDGVLIRHFPDEPLDSRSMKRIAVGQCEGQTFATRLAVRLAEQSCKRFGIKVA